VRPAFGTPGNHTYLDVSEFTQAGTTVINDVLEGDPTNTHPPLRYPWGNWGKLVGYVEPVLLHRFQGSTNPNTNTFVASDNGPSLCADVIKLIALIGLYNSGSKAPYRPIPGNGYWNSNSFTYTLLYDIGLVNPNGGNIFPQPAGWNPGWGKLVPGL
jgi:hypothetical protein